MDLNFRPLDGPFGMEVQGIDLSKNIAAAAHTLDTALTQSIRCCFSAIRS